jgi:Type III restriction enzyme, res subunit
MYMSNTQKLTIDQRYLLSRDGLTQRGFTTDLYNKFKTLIIQSQTGTGKTSATFNHIGTTNDKFISIVSKRSLAKQHINDAKKYITNRSTRDYRINDYDKKDNFVFCINSIHKYYYEMKDEINNTVLFIDEITAFCYDITHNETIYNLNNVYTMLKYLINNCKKLIVCQSEIEDNVFEFLKNRKGSVLHLTNSYIPNQNKKCNIYYNNDKIYDNMISDIKDNKPFLLSCDEKKQAKTIHNFILRNLKGSNFTPEDILLCTSEDKIELEDVKNKILVYTPSITFGCDFNFEYKANAYTFIKGNSITSDLLYQQSMRTRNLEVLNVYVSKLKNYNRKYKTMEECREQIEHNEAQFSKYFPQMLDENDQLIKQISNTSFKNLFVLNEFDRDIMKSNLIQDYKDRLTANGFIITEFKEANHTFELDIKEAANIAKELGKEELNKIIDEIQSENFDVENITDDKISHVLKVAERLNCSVEELKNTYSKYLTSEQNYKIFLNTTFFIYNKESQQNILRYKAYISFNSKTALCDEYKLFLICELFEKYEININVLNDESPISFSDIDILNQFDIHNKTHIIIATKRDLVKFCCKKLNSIIDIIINEKKGGRIAYTFNKLALADAINLYIKKYDNTEQIKLAYLELVNIDFIAPKCNILDNDISDGLN